MSLVDTVLSFFSGIAIRIALPIAITGLGIWVLRHLDRRWQSEADSNSAYATSKPRNPGCWDMKNCTAEDRSSCAAFATPETPCWQCKRNQNGLLDEVCLDCTIFKNAVPVVG